MLTTTFGYGVDGVSTGLARLWMPWTGKAFDAQAKEGRNLFTRGFRPIERVLWPGVDVADAGGIERTRRSRSSPGTGPARSPRAAPTS